MIFSSSNVTKLHNQLDAAAINDYRLIEKNITSQRQIIQNVEERLAKAYLLMKKTGDIYKKSPRYNKPTFDNELSNEERDFIDAQGRVAFLLSEIQNANSAITVLKSQKTHLKMIYRTINQWLNENQTNQQTNQTPKNEEFPFEKHELAEYPSLYQLHSALNQGAYIQTPKEKPAFSIFSSISTLIQKIGAFFSNFIKSDKKPSEPSANSYEKIRQPSTESDKRTSSTSSLTNASESSFSRHSSNDSVPNLFHELEHPHSDSHLSARDTFKKDDSPYSDTHTDNSDSTDSSGSSSHP